MASRDSLKDYRARRDFSVTAEPRGEQKPGRDGPLSFVVQKHWATRLHYDFRLEMDGVLKSWAVPKGPSLDPGDKRMAVQVEDHPLSYGGFEGSIPKGHYGAGKVIIWDRGTWEPLEDARKGWRAGKLKFELHGNKLQGRWALVRMQGNEDKPAWLLIKENDPYAREGVGADEVDAADKPRRRTPNKRRSAAAVLPAEARAARLPVALAPQLATLADAPPADAQDWLYELKLDGYRLLARVDKGEVRLYTRNGHDWTHKLVAIRDAVAQLPLRTGWLDGELVVPGPSGTPDFQALQQAFDGKDTGAMQYWLFDLPYYMGYDLRAVPLAERRTLLRGLLPRTAPANLRFSDTVDADAADLLPAACKLGFEGVIGKRRDAPYTSRRSTDWIKLKCGLRQEFVIAGYTEPQGARSGFGALVLGVHGDDGALRYAGNVGTGFSDKNLAALTEQLETLRTDRSPLAGPGVPARVHWVLPELVAEVAFAEWTRSGHVRQAVFKGLRTDKPARAIGRERAAPPGRVSKGPPAGMARITHPGRVIDKDSGLTKGDVVQYYAQVAPLMLPHLKARPVALLRAPSGMKGPQFFQKHADASELPGVRQLDPALDPGHEPLLEIATAQALVSAAQMNVLELHTWNATGNAIARPDRMTFDLDPGERVPWSRVQEAAQLLQVALTELGLQGFLKTSGGKGLHVVVPLRRREGWDTVKGFSHAVVQHMARTLPDRFVAKSGPRNRVGKIFIDYLRNGFGATTACAWTVRARPGLGISVPVAWDELGALTGGDHWKLANIAQRLAVGNDPWDGYAAARRSLGAPMKKLGFEPPR